MNAYSDWIGRTMVATDIVAPRAARQLAATLDPVPVADPLEEGAALPPLWHWLAWQPEAAMAGLGGDGHPARGGFLPPVPLERRMWAGSRLTFHAPLRIGQPMTRTSTIKAVTEKTGGAGRMVFVTVGHQVMGPQGLSITEEQDIVYVAMPDRFIPPAPTPLPHPLAWRQDIATGPVRLFRFSALTFNAHRIHVDLPYATEIEKYPGLVVHGPLQAILLMAAGRAARRAGMDGAGMDGAGMDGAGMDGAGMDGAGADGTGADGTGADGTGADGVIPATFRFRGLRPAFDTDPLTLAAGPLAGLTQPLMTATPQGAICTSAEVTWVS